MDLGGAKIHDRWKLSAIFELCEKRIVDSLGQTFLHTDKNKWRMWITKAKKAQERATF